MERRREGKRQRDRHDGVTDRQRVRQWGREMRETEWGLQLQYVRVSLQDEAAKKKKSTNFHSADTPKTNTLHGALKSALCMKHGVTHVAWVLSAASVAGAQMAMDILATAPPRGRCGLR